MLCNKRPWKRKEQVWYFHGGPPLQVQERGSKNKLIASFGGECERSDIHVTNAWPSERLSRSCQKSEWSSDGLLRRYLFSFPFSSHSMCEIKRAGGKKSFLQGFWGTYRAVISHGQLSLFRFPFVFNYKTVWIHTGGRTRILKKKKPPYASGGDFTRHVCCSAYLFLFSCRSICF